MNYSIFNTLTGYLRSRRGDIVQQKEVLVEGYYDPTLGQSDPRTETIEVVDFDALCAAIDDFSNELEGG